MLKAFTFLEQNSYLSGERSIAFDTQLGDSKRKVEVILSSYHNAIDFRDELIHGFILVSLIVCNIAQQVFSLLHFF